MKGSGSAVIDALKVSRDVHKVEGWMEKLGKVWWTDEMTELGRHQLTQNLGRLHDMIEAFARHVARTDPARKRPLYDEVLLDESVRYRAHVEEVVTDV